MTNYTITKEFGITKAQATIKAEIAEVITKALVDHFGSDDVSMIRTSGSTPSNEICVRAAEIVEDGFTYEQCVTIPITTKTYKEKITKNYTIEPFDFETAKARFEVWTKEQENKAKEREKNKAKNKTSARKAEQAERAEEVRQAIENVKAKQNED